MSRVRRTLVLPLALVALSACAEPWVVTDGVASRTVFVKARGIDGFDLRLYVPADGTMPATGLHTGFVFGPGGFVGPERYEWLARSLAKRGYSVAVPEFALQLGFFTADNLDVARRVLVEGDAAADVPALAPLDKVVVSGHSLGGVVACGAAVSGGFAALVLLASEAAGYDDVESLRIPVLSMVGSNDCSIPAPDVKVAAARFSHPLYAELAGLTHYGFTDSLAEDDAKGCESALALDPGHTLAVDVIDTFLDARLAGDALAADRLKQGFSGVTLTELP